MPFESRKAPPGFFEYDADAEITADEVFEASGFHTPKATGVRRTQHGTPQSE